MQLHKAQLQQFVRDLPKTVEADEVMYRIYLMQKIEEGEEDISQWREGKITLKTYTRESRSMPEVTPEIIRDTREKLNLSRPVFAHELHVSPRTLEKWEQGRAKPNDQAATLIMMVRKFPDTLQRLKQLAA